MSIKLTDDEALLIGIQEQNEKYNNLLEFVRKVTLLSCDDDRDNEYCPACDAKKLIKEIGENE